jgi:hypothetical protein
MQISYSLKNGSISAEHNTWENLLEYAAKEEMKW